MRLIDADELKKALAEMWYERNIRITGLSVAELIDEAPTIVPIIDTKSCGVSDLISRQLLIGAIEKCGEEKIYPQALIQTINALPSADRHEYNLETIADIVRQLGHLDSYIADTCDRPKGEWIRKENNVSWWVECSKCGEKPLLNVYNHTYEKTPYCPHCGADMRGEE